MDIIEDTKLKQFAFLISKLKALLKCPICLNVIQEAVELECHHKLCNTCYHDLSEAKFSHCPICKATIKKRCSTYKDNYSNAVGRFVSVIGMQLESVYKQKVDTLAAPSHVDTSKSTSRVPKFFPKITNEIETHKPGKENVNRRELPVTQVKKSEYLKNKLFNQNFPVNSQQSSKCDAFDKLLETSKDTLKFNRKSIRNVYTNRKKTDKKGKENKVLDFEDDKNKEAVLNWLNDTRNQFHRLTQTQNMVLPSEELMNLPSVSQPNMIETQRRRAKSLDLENRPDVVTPKRYSYNHSDLDNYNIEDPNTEGIISEEKVLEKAKENVILHLLEDELLDKMDQEIIPPEKITCDNEIKEKKSDVVGISLASCNSGWTRITEMKETVDKSIKLPKQLKITLQNKEKTNHRKKEPVHLEQHKDHSLSGANAKQQYVNLVEDGLKTIECTDNKTLENMMNNSQINIKTNILPENEFGDCPISSTSVNGKEKLLRQKCVEKNNPKKNEKLPPLGHEQNPDYISSNDQQIGNPKTTKSSIVDPITFGMIPQNTPSAEVATNHDEDVFDKIPDESITNDMIVFKDNSANPNNENDEDLYDYHRPTQKILGVDDSSKLRQSTNKLLSYINEYIQICSKESSNCALDAINQIKTYIGRLKQIDVVNVSVQTSQICKQDVFVETEFHTCNEAVQTERISKNTCSVQTSEIRQKDATFQTEPLRSEKSLKNTMDRTEKKSQILDRNCANAISNKHEGSERGGNVENELFTNSLDNVDFDTPEVVGNSSHKIQSSRDVVMRGESSFCDIPQKEVNSLEVSGFQKEDIFEIAKVQLLPPGKEAVTKKSYFGATSSNQKRTRDETEIEEITKPKKKCNRFVMDVLSVEFDNTLDKEETQEREPHGESSAEKNGINNDFPPANLEKINLSWRPSEKQISDQNTEDLREKNRGFRLKRPTKYLDEYDEIIAKVSENVERLTKQAQVARKTNQPPIEKNNSSMKNISTSKLKQFKEQFPGYSSDIISGTESITASPKKRKVKRSNEDSDPHISTHCSRPNISQTSKCLDSKENMEVYHELEDSFDEEFANIHYTAAYNVEDKPKVKILANVKIKSQDDMGKVLDDDLFSDDEDVVDTTPENRSPAMGDATDIGLGSSNVIEGEDEENLDFPALPPPLAFQDAAVHEEDTDETLKPDHSVHSLSPFKQRDQHSRSDFLCGINVDSISSNQREKKSIKAEVKKMIHSTPKTSKTAATYSLGFSPINEYTVSQGIPSAMKNNQKRNILTSTPRQISMWNFVKPSQSPQKVTPASSNSATDITAIEVMNRNSNQISQASEHMNVIPKKPCISFTRLSKDQVMCISHMTSKKLATHTTTFDKTVTHMIVSVDRSGCAKDYTVKFMAAIASGIWVLKFDWVQKCLDTNSIVPEEPYEALDDTGGQGPKTARLTRLKNPLLRNFKFYITEPLFSATRDDIEDIIKMLGGEVVSSPDQLKHEYGLIELIITEGRATQDFDIYDRWLEQYKVVTIDIEWLSKSVGRYKQISFRPYIWCSDENLEELNYPDHLVEIVPYSVDP